MPCFYKAGSASTEAMGKINCFLPGEPCLAGSLVDIL